MTVKFKDWRWVKEGEEVQGLNFIICNTFLWWLFYYQIYVQAEKSKVIVLLRKQDLK